MEKLLNQLKMMSSEEIDQNSLYQSFASNPYRHVLTDILIERKDITRNKLDIDMNMDYEEPSPEIENILLELTKPTFPLEQTDNKDEEWTALENRYYDGLNSIGLELEAIESDLKKKRQKALDKIQEVLNVQKMYRPIDERDLNNAREVIKKRFEHERNTIRDDCATKVLVLRRDIEQQGRKRRNFDKFTTDILQTWFYQHRDNPYPSDEQKADLAKQCGIKISQVNNWFGNQRIRNKQQAQRVKEQEDEMRAAQEGQTRNIIQSTGQAVQSTIAPVTMNAQCHPHISVNNTANIQNADYTNNFMPTNNGNNLHDPNHQNNSIYYTGYEFTPLDLDFSMTYHN